MTQDLVIAKPNMPLSYPIQGVEVMPLHTIMIPGILVLCLFIACSWAQLPVKSKTLSLVHTLYMK